MGSKSGFSSLGPCSVSLHHTQPIFLADISNYSSLFRKKPLSILQAAKRKESSFCLILFVWDFVFNENNHIQRDIWGETYFAPLHNNHLSFSLYFTSLSFFFFVQFSFSKYYANIRLLNSLTSFPTSAFLLLSYIQSIRDTIQMFNGEGKWSNPWTIPILGVFRNKI